MANASNVRDDVIQFDISQGGSIAANLAGGYDVVELRGGGASIPQVRLSFTSAQVGNGNANDSNTMANQDGGLAVRLQNEDFNGVLTGTASRFDDEGISFVSDGSFTFDIRDLVSGVQRGNQFFVARLGTSGDDYYSDRGSLRATYINAGAGADYVIGGRANDFLVGGAGNDTLRGEQGNDSYIGGAGDDIISDAGVNGDDLAIFNVSTDGADQVDLGGGLDTVNVSAAAGTSQIRLTFTSAEVGNTRASDAGTLANQDGDLAVRMQAEDGTGVLTGAVSRFDDEGVTFVSTTAGLTFDVRDLVSGVARGDQFSIAQLGSNTANVIDRSADTFSAYVNAGAGKDTVTGGSAADFLVGGLGNDTLNGGVGDDSLLGGADADTFLFAGVTGNDRILDFTSGDDKIDLRAFDIDFGDITTTSAGSTTLASIDVNGDGTADFTITFVNGVTPQANDYLL